MALLPPDPNAAARPPSLQRIVDLAIAYLAPQQIILFGSRARGDHRVHSDIDLAFVLSQGADAAWTHFVAAMEEAAPTLLHVDLVRMDACALPLRTSIQREGQVLYERS